MSTEITFEMNNDPVIFMGMLHDMVKYCQEKAFDDFFAWLQEWYGEKGTEMNREMALDNLKEFHNQLHDMIIVDATSDLIDDASAFLNSLGNGDSQTEGNSL
jgi:hypothetical protein